MSPTSRTSALTDIRLVSGTLQSYPGLRLAQRILVELNLIYQNLQKSGYIKTEQMVPLSIKIAVKMSRTNNNEKLGAKKSECPAPDFAFKGTIC